MNYYSRTRLILTFVGGVVTGATLVGAFVVGFFLLRNNIAEPDATEYPDYLLAPEPNDKITMFEHPQPGFEHRAFKVWQVNEDGSAEAIVKDGRYMEVLLLPQDGIVYYSNMIVNVPKGKSAKHVGICKKPNSTIPVIEISDDAPSNSQ